MSINTWFLAAGASAKYRLYTVPPLLSCEATRDFAHWPTLIAVTFPLIIGFIEQYYVV